jgi:fermentation-respiration switch protein FrsA (DUF1100 family)
MPRMLSLLLTLAIGYALILILVFVFQDRLIYFPLRPLDATPRALGLDYEDVRITTEDGVRLHGWFVPAPSARATVVHFHGNAGNISHRLEYIALFHRFGLNVFLVDYRGYGQSEGRPSEEGTYRDAMAAWRYLTETRGLAPSTIVVHGESLGGAVAIWLAAHTQPAALIVESSFTSAADLGAEVYWWIPVRWLARHPYRSLDEIAKVRSPVLVVHSRDDEIVPFRHGERLYAAVTGPKQFSEVRGGHNSGLAGRGTEYIPGIEKLLKMVLRIGT